MLTAFINFILLIGLLFIVYFVSRNESYDKGYMKGYEKGIIDTLKRIGEIEDDKKSS